MLDMGHSIVIRTHRMDKRQMDDAMNKSQGKLWTSGGKNVSILAHQL